jgi:mono/diheme cytochrome c family protein
MTRAIVFVVLTATVGRGAGFVADSARGRELFGTLSCVQCHSVNGKGGSNGLDLGRIVDRGFTPATLAATMWNHAPAMWTAMDKQGVHAGDLNEQAAADLFAYFYSARYFETPGDAARGKRTFAARCSNCHGLQQWLLPRIKPVSQWESLGDPAALTEAMWNHAPLMLAESQLKQQPWPRLAAQELTDILVYLRNLPFVPSKPPSFQIGSSTEGEAVFRAKGCAGCHSSVSQLSNATRGKTLTEVAAAMWNHEPILSKAGSTPAKFAPGEMKNLFGYLWAQQFFEDAGAALAGRRVFLSKKCAACHEDTSKAPKLERAGGFNGATMVSALWRHGPSMLSQMKKQGMAWPRFEGSQMADLIVYLNSKK